MRLEHYDEAVDWYKASLRLSESIHDQYSLTKTLGNMGWSYFELAGLIAEARPSALWGSFPPEPPVFGRISVWDLLGGMRG